MEFEVAETTIDLFDMLVTVAQGPLSVRLGACALLSLHQKLINYEYINAENCEDSSNWVVSIKRCSHGMSVVQLSSDPRRSTSTSALDVSYWLHESICIIIELDRINRTSDKIHI